MTTYHRSCYQLLVHIFKILVIKCVGIPKNIFMTLFKYKLPKSYEVWWSRERSQNCNKYSLAKNLYGDTTMSSEYFKHILGCFNEFTLQEFVNSCFNWAQICLFAMVENAWDFAITFPLFRCSEMITILFARL